MSIDTFIQRSDKTFLIPAVYSPAMWEETIQEKEGYTYEDYAKLPEGAPYQLIGGKLVMTPSPTPYHQEISKKIILKLSNFIEERALGHLYYAPLDVYLGERDIYQPDIIFISEERKEIIGPKMIKGAPDLIVEILSASTAYYDLREKFKIYEQNGVNEYWIVDPGLKKNKNK